MRPKKTRGPLKNKIIEKPKSKFNANPWICFLLFFFLPYLLWTLLTYKTWGIAYDEGIVYSNGLELRYYFSHWHHDPNDDLLVNPWFRGGVFFYSAFESLFFYYDKVINFAHYHLANQLFASIIFGCFFILIWKQYRNILWALGGAWALVLTPRFFGSIAFNPRDVPFAVIYFAGLTIIYLSRNLDKSNWGLILLLGSSFGIITCGRIIGFTLFVILFLFNFYETWARKFAAPKDGSESINWVNWFWNESFFLILTFIVSQFAMLALWPYLRVDYFHRFFEILQMGKQFQWNGLILLAGKLVWAAGHPWYYVPVWFLVGLPVSLLAFFFLSLWNLLKIKDAAQCSLYVLFFFAFSINLLMYLIMNPVIYNAERHFFYLMVIVVFLAFLGIIEFFKSTLSKEWKIAVMMALAINGVTLTIQMVRLHPYEFIYFNELVGGLPGAMNKYQTEYWGVSLKEGAEWLRDHECLDPNRKYKIKCNGHQCSSMTYFSKNMEIISDDYQGSDADYFLFFDSNHDQITAAQTPQIIHTVEREGVPLAYILKLR